MSKALHFCLPIAANADDIGDAGTGRVLQSPSSSISISPISPGAPSTTPIPMFDPSINANPLAATGKTTVQNPEPERGVNDKPKKRRATDVSKHTFYIENSQVRLKLVARNEVRLCLMP
jgi:phospholipase D1/2